MRRGGRALALGLFEADPSLGVSVYLRDLEAGPWTGIDEDASYVPASLMKVGVLFHALARLAPHFDARDLEAGQQLHECGIVYVPDGSPFTLCVMTRSLLQSRDDLATIVAEIAHRAWTVMVTARGSVDSTSLGGD